ERLPRSRCPGSCGSQSPYPTDLYVSLNDTLLSSGLAFQSLLAQLVEIGLPVGRAIPAKLAQIVPAVDAGRVHVIEGEPHRVVANRRHLHDGDVLLAGDRFALGRRMALHLGARAAHTQILGREVIALAVVEGDG